MIFFDCEVYQNYFLVTFKNNVTGKVSNIEFSGLDSSLCSDKARLIYNLLESTQTVGFNSLNYDVPVLSYVMSGKSCNEIYKLSKYIIESDDLRWDIARKFEIIDHRFIKHIDIKGTSPAVNVGLKQYAGRVHFHKLQELPIDPHKLLTIEEMGTIKKYCLNDVDVTIALFNKIEPRLLLRKSLGERYGLNLFSRSDPQFAEDVILSELKKTTDIYFKSGVIYPEAFYFKTPSHIVFKTPIMQNLIKEIETTAIEVSQPSVNKKGKHNPGGKVVLPPSIREADITLGNTQYQLGVGGLHSKDKALVIIPKSDELLIDMDVTSYYPSLILTLVIYPPQLTSNFLSVYEKLVNARIEAKQSGDKVTADGLKIAINGGFGKMGSIWSKLYHPPSLVRITLGGQLSLLMLIETLELNNISVVSVNTDSVTCLLKKDQEPLRKKLCDDWQKTTRLNLESDIYKSLYMRDVNNYFAVNADDKVKGKGIFGEVTLQKNSHYPIVQTAVINCLTKGIPIEETIKGCTDITKFIIMKKATGGAMWRGTQLGKLARWVYSKKGDHITDAKSGNKVGESANALPLMDLPDKLPECLDYDIYIKKAYATLAKLGV